MSRDPTWEYYCRFKTRRGWDELNQSGNTGSMAPLQWIPQRGVASPKRNNRIRKEVRNGALRNRV